MRRFIFCLHLELATELGKGMEHAVPITMVFVTSGSLPPLAPCRQALCEAKMQQVL
jgi:hypothetical protein